MELQSGKYTIRCKEDDYFIGRHWVEDRSANPKKIWALEQHMTTPKWEFVKQENTTNHYILKTRDTATANIQGKVFALLLEGRDQPTVWEIKPHPTVLGTYYTIGVAGSNPPVGWAAPSRDQDNGNGQISIKNLPPPLGFPLPVPQIPFTMRFTIEKAEEEDDDEEED